jgi:hypothetical protein
MGRRLLLTLLVMVLIGGGAWVALRMLGEPPKPVSARQPLVPQELLTSWDQIDLDLLSDQNLRIVREPGAFVIHFGSDEKGNRLMHKDEVDMERLQALLLALHDSFREPLQGSAEDLLRAGLDPPRYHLTIRRGEGASKEEVALGFGNDDPTGQGILARCYTDKTVFRTGKQVANLLELNLRDWRSRVVFTIDPMVVDQINVVKYGKGQGSTDQVLTAVKQGPRTWRLTQPRDLRADPNTCQSLARQAALLEIETFVSEAWSKQTAPTELPDDPSWELQISEGPRTQQLVIGKLLPGQGYPCTMPQRDPNMCFTVKPEALAPLLQIDPDKLRPKRLFPNVEKSMVGLKCLAADGKSTRWFVEKEAQHPAGHWIIKVPFEGRANEGKGNGSFAQVVAELNRYEVEAFLPPDTPFEPEAILALQWNELDPSQKRLLVDRSFLIARDPEHGRTLVRDPEQPGELFAMHAKLGDLPDLDLQLFRDRQIFPKDYSPKVRRTVLSAPDHATLELEKASDAAAAEPKGATLGSDVAPLQSAVSGLWNQYCAGYVRAKTVLSKPGAADPFAKIAFELTLTTAEGTETLTVSGAPPSEQAPEGIYCKLTPRLPDDVWMVVERPTLEPFFRMLLPK